MPGFNTIYPIPVVLEHDAEGRRVFEVDGQCLTLERWLERRDEEGHLLEIRPFTPEELQAFASQPHATLWGLDPGELGLQVARAGCHAR